MRVIHLLKTSTGATWALRQIRELIRHGLEVHVALPHGPLVRQYLSVGANVHVVDTAVAMDSVKSTFRSIANVRDLVSDINPDLIHSHFVANTIAVRIALGRDHPTRRIFQVPGPLHLEHAFFRSADLMSAGTADYWLASCRWTRDKYVASGVSPRRVGLIYYGIDIPENLQYRNNRIRREYGIGDKQPLLGSVSYFYPPKRYLGQKVGLKGHEDLFDALEIVGKSVSDLVCIVVGEAWGGADWYFDRLLRKANRVKHARVIMAGFRDDIFEIYPDFDLAVHPSHSENLGGAVESLAYGVPTIATNVGGFPDLVVDGETGLLVPPKSPPHLAEAILRMFADPHASQRMARQGRERVCEILDIRANARDLVKYYETLLQRGCLTPDAVGRT